MISKNGILLTFSIATPIRQRRTSPSSPTVIETIGVGQICNEEHGFKQRHTSQEPGMAYSDKTNLVLKKEVPISVPTLQPPVDLLEVASVRPQERSTPTCKHPIAT